MDLRLRAMGPEEWNYAVVQPCDQILRQTGCVGQLGVVLGDRDDAFFRSWVDAFTHEKRTPGFRVELERVLHKLRFDNDFGCFLKDLDSLRDFCEEHSEAKEVHPVFGPVLGFRVDSERYSYLIRVDPERDSFQGSICCYEKEKLDRHMDRARGGVRFVDGQGREVFRVPDGGEIEIIRPDGKKFQRGCRYVDEDHFLMTGGLGKPLFQTEEFAEKYKDVLVIPIVSVNLDEQIGMAESVKNNKVVVFDAAKEVEFQR